MRFRNPSIGSSPALRVIFVAAVGIGVLGCSSQATTPVPPAASATPSAAPSVVPSPSPTATPVALRDLTGTRYFGTAVPVRQLTTDAAYADILNKQFNQVTPENAMKWGPLEAAPGSFDWSGADSIVASAQAHGQKVRGHTLVWHSQLPAFISDGKFTKAQLNETVKQHIYTEVGHFKGKIYAWDVVNEALNEDGTMRESIFYKTLGEGYVADAFYWARTADPAAKLYINDYNVEDINAKSDALYALVKKLKASGVPIDGVGFQAHFDTTYAFPAKMTENLQRFADLGVEVAVTELDVRVIVPSTPASLTKQAGYYKQTVEACLAVTACVGITAWGISDRDSWVPSVFPGQGDADLYDNNLAPKPAYDAVVQALKASK